MDAIPGYNGYYLIDKEGRVYSKYGKYELRQTPNSNGYLRVFLFKGGSTKTFYVHRLMGYVYLGLNISNSNELVCHKNDIVYDNSVGNLFVGTTKDNMHDMIRKGRNSMGILHQVKNRGERSKLASISNDQAILIKKMIRDGIRLKTISKELSISYSIIKSINLGRSWRWLEIQ